MTVRLTRADGGGTRLEVSDPDAYAWLIRRRPGPDDETGRGLLLLDAVALCWGVEQGSCGKTVWCELPHGARAGLFPVRKQASGEHQENEK
ncbi:ATP-binding protein [Streptomyces sp. NPDC006365]|uniref:ATP-binding protein n=1 Tax=Streptomyces sp. NPDC006365 TaxID=3364744 RepID=UPI00368EFD89